MNAQNNAVLEDLLFEKVLAHLYIDLLPEDGTAAARARIQETLAPTDEAFAIQRPSPEELTEWAQKRRELDAEIPEEMAYRALEEVVAYSQGKFGAAWTDELRSRIEILCTNLLKAGDTALSEDAQVDILTAICNDVLGLGPLEPLLADSSVVEVMVDGPAKVYVERHGKLEDTVQCFRDEAHLMAIIHRIVAPLGCHLNASRPMVDARLSDGSRVNIVLPPVSLTGPVLTIRKFSKRRLTLEDIVRFGAISEEIATLIRACVEGRLNVIISGNTGSGKTTLLDIVAQMIPDGERIITIENAAELHDLPKTKKYVVSLEARPPNIKGEGGIGMRDLLASALRMRPDRIVMGELRGDEALDLIQAMNSGHEGCITTLHAVAPPDAVQRLETMMTQHPTPLPVLVIRKMIADAIDVIVHIDRVPDGSRKVTSVAEVLKLEGNVIMLQDIFQFEITGQEEGQITGRYLPTGIIPHFLERIQAQGIDLPLSLFTPR